jgi:hypothetical protein
MVLSASPCSTRSGACTPGKREMLSKWWRSSRRAGSKRYMAAARSATEV